MPDVAAPGARALLAEATRTLAARGIPEPRRTALAIWRDLVAGAPGAVLPPGDDPVPAAEAARFEAAVARRAGGEPLAHVTGLAGFRHLVLRSDARALIPRPETEGIVDLLLSRLRTGRVADIGTGTGCLALSLAQEGGFSQVVGVDLSRAALDLAAENRARTGLPVQFVCGDLTAPLATGAFDAVVSNPPYLTAAEHAALDASVAQWEPALALVSGEDGLAATWRLLADLPRVVRPGGWMVLEVDCHRAAHVGRRAAELGWQDVLVVDDLFGRARHVIARRSDAS